MFNDPLKLNQLLSHTDEHCKQMSYPFTFSQFEKSVLHFTQRKAALDGAFLFQRWYTDTEL